MSNSLFVGNGINRCTVNKNIAWNDLLGTLATEFNVEHNEKLSFPLDFECIANQLFLKHCRDTSYNVYQKLKYCIAEKIEQCELPEDAVHWELAKLPVKRIFTTNYDYLIEKSIDITFDMQQINASKIGKYNLKYPNCIGGKQIYHVHGQAKNPDSICLGYEHYSGTLQHLRNRIATKNRESGLLIKSFLTNDNSEEEPIWANYIFSDNIDIIGLGLGKDEIDIWWLLTYRAYLYYSNYENTKELITNTITFHHVATSEDDNMKYALKYIHVNYKHHKIPNNENCSYFDGYMKAIEEISKKLG